MSSGNAAPRVCREASSSAHPPFLEIDMAKYGDTGKTREPQPSGLGTVKKIAGTNPNSKKK